MFNAVDGVVNGRMDDGEEAALHGWPLKGGEDGLFRVGVPVGDRVRADDRRGGECRQREADGDEGSQFHLVVTFFLR